MQKYLWVVALVLSTQAASAEEGGWLALKATQGEYRLSMNTQSIKREAEVVNVTFRYVYPETQIFPFLNKKYDSTERLFYFQCAEHKMVAAQNDFFMGKALVHSISAAASNPLAPNANQPQPVPPNTPEEEAFNYACKFVPGKK